MLFNQWKKNYTRGALIFLSLLMVSGLSLFAQDETVEEAAEAEAEANTDLLDTRTAKEELQEVSINKFEDDAFWDGHMSIDDGVISIMSIAGGPAAKDALPEDAAEGLEESDDYILGIRVDFFRRSLSEFVISARRPIPVEGITKTITVWAAGRNTNHVLYVRIKDHFGNLVDVRMGTLNFVGWQKLTATIPPYPQVVQRDFHYVSQGSGIMIEGFRVDCDLDEAYGTFYLYLDDLRVYSDLFSEGQGRLPDDPVDGWG